MHYEGFDCTLSSFQTGTMRSIPPYSNSTRCFLSANPAFELNYNSFLSKANPTGAEPVPSTPLIYFTHKGRYIEGFNGDAQIPAMPSKTYRLRVINTSSFAMFLFWIDGHDMRIIEVDGVRSRFLLRLRAVD